MLLDAHCNGLNIVEETIGRLHENLPPAVRVDLGAAQVAGRTLAEPLHGVGIADDDLVGMRR